MNPDIKAINEKIIKESEFSQQVLAKAPGPELIYELVIILVTDLQTDGLLEILGFKVVDRQIREK